MFKTIGYLLEALNLAIQSLSRLTVNVSGGAEDITDIARDEICVVGEGQRTQHVLDRRDNVASLKGHKFTKLEESYIFRARNSLLT